MIRVTDKDSFVESANKIHKFKYSYPNFVYTKSTNKSSITCHKHGDFMQSANKHLQGRGCPECSKIERGLDKTAKSLLGINNKLITKYGDKYSYPNFTNIRRKDKIKVICNEHGEFITTLDRLLRRGGCPTCGYNSERVKTNGSSESVVYRAAERNNTKPVFYIVKLRGNGEEFLKIGVTSNLKSRFRGIFYDVVETATLELPTHSPFTLEKLLKVGIKKFFPELVYTPKIKFGGYTECFKTQLLTNFSQFKD